MSIQTPLELVFYYANLLILQYISKAKAYAQVSVTCAPVIMPQVSTQAIDFGSVPTSGTFVLSYHGNNTAAINWNDSVSIIQTKLRAVSGLSSVTVTGSIASQVLDVTFTGVIPPADLLLVSSNNLLNSFSVGVQITISETDQTLPLQVQNGFNVTGGNIAAGVQLDIIGKYVGVVRTGNGPNGPITLNDSDFLVLIRFAIAQNNSGSSLQDIQDNLNMFFPGDFIVTDYQNMYMSYILSATLGSPDLFTLLVEEKLLPKPMGVGLSVIIPPVVDTFFGFSSYNGLNTFVKPFNTYDNFNTNWLWLSYDDAVIV